MTTDPATLRGLFEEALALDPAARGAFLDRHCPDPALRARIERMLAADTAGDHAVLDQGAEAIARVIGDADFAQGLPAGSRIGPFELIEVIGEGGSSTVFRAARTIDGVRQIVALKLLRRGLYSSDAQRQFRRERRALAELNHPGIARLIEGGVAESGLAYIALDLVEGVPITDYAREHRFDLRLRLKLFLQVCRAVEAAHRALIVHRDLKPSNVLVTSEGIVKLLDFGIAKLLDADDDETTRTRLPAFTPAYAAPEQREGGLVTTATDVYALGVLLGELVTGQRLHGGSGRTPSSEISGESADGVLPAGPAATRRQLRGDLDNIVLKAIDPEAERRYASAGEFAHDIERLLDGRPVAAHPPSRWYRARKFVARHRGGVATAVAFALAIMAAFGLALWQADVARQQRNIARDAAERAESHARRAQAVQDFLGDLFRANSRNQPDPVKARQTTARDLLDLGAQKIEASMNDAPEAKLGVLQLLGQLYDDLELADEAVRVRKQAVELARTVHGKDSLTVAEELIKLASAMPSSKSANETNATLEEAGRLLDLNHDDRSQARGTWLRRRADYFRNFDPPRALDYASQAVRLFQARPPSVDLTDSLLTEAIQEIQLRRLPEAAASLQRAIEVSAFVPEAAPNVLKYYAYLGEAQSGMMDLAGAEASMRKAFEMARATSGAESIDALQTGMRLGGLLFDTGRTEEGLALLRATKDLALKVRGPDDPFHTRSVLSAHGKAQVRAGAIEEGLDDIDAAIRLDRRNRPGSIDLASRLELQAIALFELGRFGQARASLDEAAQIREQAKQARDTPPFNLNIRLRAQLELAQGDAEGARKRLAAIVVDDKASNGISFERFEMELLSAEIDLAAHELDAARESVALVRQQAEHSGLSPFLVPYLARADLTEGLAAIETQRARDALPLLQRALTRRKTIFLPASPKIAEAEIALAGAYLDIGDAAKARALAADAIAIQARHKELAEPYRLRLRLLQTRLNHS